MSNQRKFIKKAFEYIKNHFEEFRNENISLIIRNHTKVKYTEKVIKLEYIDKSDDQVNYIIYMVDDCYQLLKDRPNFYESIYLEDKDFLESLNIITEDDISIPEEIIIIDFLLHEFGHISHIKKILDISTPRVYRNIAHINNQSIALLLNSKGMKYLEGFSFGENYAEMFKFKHLYKIWKELQ